MGRVGRLVLPRAGELVSVAVRGVCAGSPAPQTLLGPLLFSVHLGLSGDAGGELGLGPRRTRCVGARAARPRRGWG